MARAPSRDVTGWIPTLRRRARTARWLLGGRRECWLALRVLGLSATASTVVPVLPLSTLARLALRRRSAGRQSWPDRDQKALAMARWVYGTGEGRCLQRSLVLARLLSETHSDVRVVVGMRRGERGLTGHAWLLVEGQPFGDDPGAIGDFEPVHTFGSDEVAGDRS